MSLSSEVEWRPVTGEEQQYLVLDTEPFMTRGQDYQDKMAFWQQLFPC